MRDMFRPTVSVTIRRYYYKNMKGNKLMKLRKSRSLHNIIKT